MHEFPDIGSDSHGEVIENKRRRTDDKDEDKKSQCQFDIEVADDTDALGNTLGGGKNKEKAEDEYYGDAQRKGYFKAQQVASQFCQNGLPSPTVQTRPPI